MAVKIRLKRMGKIRTPFYRIVVADSRKKRDGRVIEEIGTYNPKAEPSLISVDGERAQYWLGVGAPNIGSAIQDALDFPCRSDETSLELLRGVRMHFTKFIKQLDKGGVAALDQE